MCVRARACVCVCICQSCIINPIVLQMSGRYNYLDWFCICAVFSDCMPCGGISPIPSLPLRKEEDHPLCVSPFSVCSFPVFLIGVLAVVKL